MVLPEVTSLLSLLILLSKSKVMVFSLETLRVSLNSNKFVISKVDVILLVFHVGIVREMFAEGNFPFGIRGLIDRLELELALGHDQNETALFITVENLGQLQQ